MNIRILVVAIICVISVSTAEAFEFRGHTYEWGTHINDVRKNEAALKDSELVPSSKTAF